jgi:hypothetical protein
MPHFWNALVIRFTQYQNIPQIAYSLLLLFNEDVLWAQPCFKYIASSETSSGSFQKTKKVAVFPDDSLWYKNQQVLSSNVEGAPRIDKAWLHEVGSPEIRVGICDLGLFPEHPDLGGAPIGLNTRILGGFNYASGNNDLWDWPNSIPPRINPWALHGTMVTGIIGASSNNRIGIPGVAGGDNINSSGASLYGLVANNSQTIAYAIWEAVE